MKRIILPILLFCATLSISAQEYLHINSHWHENYIFIDEIDSIAYGEMSYQSMLPAIMAEDPNISIFNEALQLTHLCDSMLDYYDYNYRVEHGFVKQASFQNAKYYGVPTIRKGYTVFVEPDSVYAKYGIHNIADLKAYAARVYDEMYPEDANISDPTDRRNSLNRFVAYHILEVQSHKQNLTAAKTMSSSSGRYLEYKYIAGIDISEWYETMMPHSLMKCTAPYNNRSTVFINSCGEANPLRGETSLDIKGAEVTNYSISAINGFCHYISDIIAYDKQTQTVVLDEQIIINNATMSPEIINNNLRLNFPYYTSVGGVPTNAVYLPEGSLKNFKSHSPYTEIYYLYADGWSDYQADEMMVSGNFDFSIKLPSVPAGTYELNLGCNVYAARPIVACYLDEVPCDTLDITYNSEFYKNWVSDYDLETSEAIAQNDSLLFSNGYRKGLFYYLGGNYSGKTTMRDGQYCTRAIITTFTTDGKSDHYLRFKSLDERTYMEFHIDFLELCPTHLLKEYK